jgi:hypothetical protein
MTMKRFAPPDDEAAWKETERRAAEAGRYWRKTFQTETPELRRARALEASIKAIHQGNKP